MKHLLWLVLLPAVAMAGNREDYAQQWPLRLQDAEAGAYRVTLDRDVYRSATSPSLDDIEIFNGDRQAVPSALFAPDVPLAQASPLVTLPWFALPAGKAARVGDITLISERDADGGLRRVETRVADASQTTSAPLANAWLIDASRVRGRIAALQLDWPAGASAIDVGYRVEGSDDLRDWRTLQAHTQLLDLPRDGERLQQRRIALDGQARYLRLLPERADAVLPLSGVRAELAAASAAQDWRWETLQGRRVVDQDTTYYEFTLDGRFPMTRADVVAGGNAAGEWTLQSRDDDDTPWQVRAGPWIAFQVGADASQRSAEQTMETPTRDRYWRLSSRTPVQTVPVLRLGYRAEVMVFLTQGNPPYTLASGSAKARRADAPLTQLVDAIRIRRGSDWQPAPATLGKLEMLAGDSARVPMPPERDWKAWMLWGVLILGALVVAGFAVSLLRRTPPSA